MAWRGRSRRSAGVAVRRVRDRPPAAPDARARRGRPRSRPASPTSSSSRPPRRARCSARSRRPTTLLVTARVRNSSTGLVDLADAAAVDVDVLCPDTPDGAGREDRRSRSATRSRSSRRWSGPLLGGHISLGHARSGRTSPTPPATRRHDGRRRHDRAPASRGQVLVMALAAMVVLISMLGLAIDGGRGYWERRQAQNAAEHAALAAAWEHCHPTGPSTAARPTRPSTPRPTTGSRMTARPSG